MFSHVARGPGQRWVFGAQERDGLTLPTEVVDGRTPWREALAAARAEGAADLDEAVVVALWQRGLLGAD
ncbi:MAG: hypothetical protein U1F43_34180 [Myxococcota bacterium]